MTIINGRKILEGNMSGEQVRVRLSRGATAGATRVSGA